MEILKVLQKSTKVGFSLLGIEGCDSGGILGFEKNSILKLLKEKMLKGDFWKDEVYNDDPFREGLSLIVGVDAQDDLWDYEEPKNIDRFISNIYLGYYKSLPQPNLVLASPLCLFDLLTIYSDYFQNIGIDHLQDISGKQCKPDVKLKTINWLKKEENLSGRVYVCDYSQKGMMPCGEPLCASDFAWIKRGLAFFYMHTGGDFITSAWLYPFVTDSYKNPNRVAGGF